MSIVSTYIMAYNANLPFSQLEKPVITMGNIGYKGREVRHTTWLFDKANVLFMSHAEMRKEGDGTSTWLFLKAYDLSMDLAGFQGEGE